jgi:phage gp16-like protein
VSKALPQSERKRMLAKIHIAKKQLGWEDDFYRQALQDVAGVDSSAKLDVRGFKLFLDYLYRCGFRDGAPKDKSLSPRTSDKAIKTRKDKAVALWIELAKAGLVRDRSHEALGNFARRFMGKKTIVLPGTDPLDAASPYELGKVITALENWLNGSDTAVTAESGVSQDCANPGDGISDERP